MDAQSTEARRLAVVLLAPEGPNAVRELLGFLGDSSWRVRKAALSRLDDFRGRPTLLVELIAGVADDTNAGLRSACCEALLEMGESVETLIAALHTTNTNQRRVVAEILGSVARGDATDRLIATLDDVDPNARAAAAEALGHVGGAAVIAELAARLGAAVDDLQQSAYLLDALGRAGAVLAYETLAIWLSRRPMVRHVYLLLGHSGDRRAIDPLLDGLVATSWGTRRAALLACERLAETLDDAGRDVLRSRLTAGVTIPGVLVAAMASEEPEVGAAAARLFGVIGDARAAPSILEACAAGGFLRAGIEVVQEFGEASIGPLVEALPLVATDAQVLALEVLEVLADDRVLGVCVEIAGGDEPRSAEAALRVLGELGGVGVVNAVIAVVATGDPDLLDQAALTLAAIGQRSRNFVADRMCEEVTSGTPSWVWYHVLGALHRPRDLPLVSAGVANGDVAIRRAAAAALAEYGAAASPGVLLGALGDRDAAVRAVSAHGLRGYRGGEIYDALVGVLADEDPWVVAEALRTLGVIDAENAVPRLVEAAASSASPIVLAAIETLARIEPPELQAAVGVAIGHPEPEVVRVALQATSHLPAPAARTILVATMRHPSWDVRRSCATLLEDRGIRLPRQLVRDHLATEIDPLVREALERVQLEHGELT